MCQEFFFPFVDTSVAGKLHFRYKMHAETYTQGVVVTKILYVCSNHGILASDSFCVMSCHINSSSTFVSLYCHLKIDLSSRHEQTKLIYMPF